MKLGFSAGSRFFAPVANSGRYEDDAASAELSGYHDRSGRGHMALSLRAKAFIGFVLLVVYVAMAGLLIAQQRDKLFRTINELEQAYAQEEVLTKANASLMHAILSVNNAHYVVDAARGFESVALDVEAVQAGLQDLVLDHPALSKSKDRLIAHISTMRTAPERAYLLDVRESLHGLVSELDTLTNGVRERKKNLANSYRLAHDATTVIASTAGLVGVVLFGSLVALFFSRLAWDINKLEARARQVIQGYRGTSLQVTRTDELGELMKAVNQMQSDLRSREQQLELARQRHFHQERMAMAGSLAAAIAHEINNPLAAIVGAAGEMSKVQQLRACRALGMPCSPELIVEQTERIARITRQLSDLTAPSSAEAQLIDINGLLRRTCNLLGYDRRLRGVDINLDLDSQLPAVHAVPDEITQIAMNLLLNAADACALSDKPRIDVSTRIADDGVVLAIGDSGCGMSEANCARAFDEGYTTKLDGHGIGLFLCKSLLESRGGKIDLTSRLGEGTQVTVRLSLQPTIAQG